MPPKSDFSPPDTSFPEEVGKYRDATAEKCDFFQSFGIVKGYGNASPAELEYYLYWRSQLRKGTFSECDYGYVLLRLSEMVIDGDPKENVREMSLILKSFSPYSIEYKVTSQTLFEYCLYRGIDMKGLNLLDEFAEVIAGEYVRGNFELLDANGIIYIGNRNENLYDLDNTTAFIVCKALHAIDENMIERTGVSMSEAFGKPSAERLNLFRNLIWHTDDEYILEYRDYTADREFMRIFLNTALYVIALFEDRKKAKKCPAAELLTDDEKRIIEQITSGDIPDFPRRDYGQCYKLRPAELNDINLIDLTNPDEVHPKPKYNRLFFFFSRPRNMDKFLEDAETYEDVYRTEVRKYCSYPKDGLRKLSSLNREQLEYYLFWRTLAAEKKYTDCDGGYVWHYLFELVNMNDDTEYVADQMIGLYRAYRSEMILNEYCEYAIVNDIPYMITDASGLNSVAASYALDKMFDRGTAGLSINAIIEMCMIRGNKAEEFRDIDGCADVVNRCLMKINYKTDIRKKYRIRTKKVRINSISSVRIINRREETPEKVVTVHGYVSCSAFLKNLQTLTKGVVNALTGSRKLKQLEAFGIDCIPVINEVIDEIKTEEQLKLRRKIAGKISLSASSIEKAENDLNSVSEMMSVEEEEPETSVEFIDKNENTGTGWEAFGNMLDDKCRAYLSDILSGNKIKKNTGIEDAINSASMDTIGDTVVENGIIIEDYEDELREIL